MPSSYPGAIDALTNPVATDQTNSPSHAGQHANANDAIEAIETALGVNPHGAAATVAARIAALPQGVLAFVSSTTNSSDTSGTTLLVTQTVSPTIAANRKLRITHFIGRSTGSNAGDTFRYGLQFAGAIVAQLIRTIDHGDGLVTVAYVADSGTAGAKTIEATLQRQGGTGFAGEAGTADSARWLMVEDLGAA